MEYTYIQVRSAVEISAVLGALDQQGIKWVNATNALAYVPEYDFSLKTVKRCIMLNKADGYQYLQTESFYEGERLPVVGRWLAAGEFLNECEGVKTIPFSELKKGQVFRFSGQKKVFEVLRRLKKEIEYFPHDNIWGDYRQKKKSSKLTVEIGFTY